MRAAREAMGMTQKQMAKKIGISQRFYSKIERGETPGLEYRRAIADVLSLDLRHPAPPTGTPTPPEAGIKILRELRALRADVAKLRGAATTAGLADLLRITDKKPHG